MSSQHSSSTGKLELGEKNETPEQTEEPKPTSTTVTTPKAEKKGWRFWLIFPPLCVATLLAAMEATVTSTALPTIARKLNTGSEYPWYNNAYLLTNAIVIPLYGQFAFVFGRRYPAMIAVSIFMIGSGISGGANSSVTLIAGRTVQGIGGGGISVVTQLIISDLVSVRERGKYMGIIFAVFGLGTAIGPVIGGAIAGADGGDQWRWVFWLNLPICAITLILQVLFLQVTYKKLFTFKQKMAQIDWVGNFLLICSVVSILIALSWADTKYPWSNWRVIFCLVLGVVLMIAFHSWEASPWVGRPTISPKVFGNRTSVICLILTFFQSMMTYWRIFVLPIYFQGVRLASPGRSGVLLLPSVLPSTFVAILAGQIMTRWGKYKPIHIWGFGVTALGTGLYIDLNTSSSLAKVVIYQIITAVGNGVLFTCMLPAIQAVLPQSEVSVATSTWGFVRAYGGIWGTSIPTAIFNSRVAQELYKVSDPSIRAALGTGNAYSHVSGNFISSLPRDALQQVFGVYNESLRVVWIVCTAFCGFCFLLCFLEQQVEMRTTVSSDFGLKKKKKVTDGDTEMGNTRRTGS